MKLGFGPIYFLKCVLTDSVNNSILKRIDFGLNGPDRVTYMCQNICHIYQDLNFHDEIVLIEMYGTFCVLFV